MAYWLLEPAALGRLQAAAKSDSAADASAQVEYETSATESNNRLLTFAGSDAAISVKGTLTKKPDWLARVFGGGNSVYADIISALAEADANPAVKQITMNIDSPGGEFDGLFDVIDAMQSTKKPINAVIDGLGASAAYAIASQATSIRATSKAARIGSVGVAATLWDDPNSVSIASTNAPKKRPDVSTTEGVAVIREELDAMHDIFVDAIATGRKTTVKNVNSNFGEGGTLLADAALANGMIDSVGKISSTAVVTQSSGANTKVKPMDLETLKVQHPETYAAALKVGAADEKDRVTAHLELGAQCGAMDIATQAVADGSGLTQGLIARYTAASLRNRDIGDRVADDVEASAADSADTASDADSETDRKAKASQDMLSAMADTLQIDVEV